MNTSLLGTTRLLVAMTVVALATSFASVSRAGIMTTADEAYPAAPIVFTADPLLHNPANRGLTTDRELRQTFKNPTTFDVRKIVISFDVNDGGASGLRLQFVEVDDVNASTFVAGNLIKTIELPASTYSNTSDRLGISLSGSDIFTLPRRGDGTTGYALIVSQIDQAATNAGTWDHTNVSATDIYPNGRYYTESNGSQGNGHRDYGLALATPEPASLGLMLLGLCGWVVARRVRMTND